MGVNLAITKALVFGLSAALCALPGSLSAIRTGNVTPDSTNITVQGAITFLIVMVVGGAGSLWGPIIGAGLFVFITELTGDWSDPAQIPGIIRPLFSWSNTPPGSGIFAILLIVLMFVAPFGIVGMWKRLIARFVTVTPRPAGTGTIQSVVSAPAEA
jgi:branched-chain amino acid transport system permease protein